MSMVRAELLAAGSVPGPRSSKLYHVIVKDLLLKCRIGIHPHEKLAPQRVCINADLEAMEAPGRMDDDVANVLNYEYVVTGIKALAAGDHINLVETLAEQIAALCLSDPRVVSVRLRVEKLDVYAEAHSVGIEIERRRPAGATAVPVAAGGGIAPSVVKLGGSLIESPGLAETLAALCTPPLAPVVVVPGGGPFADGVRAVQRQRGLDDKTAHVMALLAMDQFGRMLAGLDRRFAVADRLPALREAVAAGRSVIWLPAAMTIGQPDIAESWDVTSDSLAAWLAGRLGARELVLLKSAALAADDMAVADLVAAGIVDAAFGSFATGAFPVFVADGGDPGGLRQAAIAGRAPGRRVRLR